MEFFNLELEKQTTRELHPINSMISHHFSLLLPEFSSSSLGFGFGFLASRILRFVFLESVAAATDSLIIIISELVQSRSSLSGSSSV